MISAVVAGASGYAGGEIVRLLLGLLLLPWTTLAYLIVWSPIVGVDGAEWIVVAIGFAADVLTYSGRAASSRYEASRGY